VTNRPRIGDFRSVPENAPRTTPVPSTPPAAEPAPTPPENGSVAPTGELATTKIPAEMTPRERYQQRLADAKISLTEAAAIYDAIIEKGYYEEFVNVGKTRAVFRTRLYDDTLRLQQALEAARPSLVVTQEDMITRYNLAASLYAWKGETFKHENDDDFDKILEKIKKMPGPLFSLLAQKLAEFDQKTMVIFSDGATDSF
jgi:hypothetical protein